MPRVSSAHPGPETVGAGGDDAGSISTALRDWTGEVLPGVAVRVTARAEQEPVDGIAIRLAGLAPRVVPLSPGHKVAAIALDYLITVHLADPIAAHAAVSELAFAAAEDDLYEIVTGLSVYELCRSIGAEPAPGLILRAELRRDKRLPRAPLVREAPQPQLEPLVQARGRVVGPGSLPIAGALVSIEGTSRCCTTGSDGRFHFAVPAGQPATVTARSGSRAISASLAPETETILTLQMED